MARKKCPQGVLCIENITLIFSILIVGIGYLIYCGLKNKQQGKNIFYTMTQPNNMQHSGFNFNIPTNIFRQSILNIPLYFNIKTIISL